MKKMSFFALCLIIAALFLASPAGAQSCGALYQYSDMWIDGSGNAVGDNYTEADTCGNYSYTTFADVTVDMPSGASYYSSVYGYSASSEALAEAAASEESGDGSFDVFSEVDYSCGDSLTAFGSNPIKVNAGSEWIWYENKGLNPIVGKCFYGLGAQCNRTDGIYCGEAHPSIYKPCGDGIEMYQSWVEMYGYLEVKIGPLLIGGCLNPKPLSYGSVAPAVACRAIPPHL